MNLTMKTLTVIFSVILSTCLDTSNASLPRIRGTNRGPNSGDSDSDQRGPSSGDRQPSSVAKASYFSGNNHSHHHGDGRSASRGEHGSGHKVSMCDELKQQRNHHSHHHNLGSRNRNGNGIDSQEREKILQILDNIERIRKEKQEEEQRTQKKKKEDDDRKAAAETPLPKVNEDTVTDANNEGGQAVVTVTSTVNENSTSVVCSASVAAVTTITRTTTKTIGIPSSSISSSVSSSVSSVMAEAATLSSTSMAVSAAAETAKVSSFHNNKGFGGDNSDNDRRGRKSPPSFCPHKKTIQSSASCSCSSPPLPPPALMTVKTCTTPKPVVVTSWSTPEPVFVTTCSTPKPVQVTTCSTPTPVIVKQLSTPKPIEKTCTFSATPPCQEVKQEAPCKKEEKKKAVGCIGALPLGFMRDPNSSEDPTSKNKLI